MRKIIKELIYEGYLKTKVIIEAFDKINREDFVPENLKEEAYLNMPLGIGYGQTISQPLTVAFMLELLQPQEGDKILDIGSGSGYATALLSYIVGKKGNVYAIERYPELKEFGQKNVAKYGFAKCHSKRSKRPREIQRDPSVSPQDDNNDVILSEAKNPAGRGIVKFFCADGSKGLPQQAPFDKIHIAAAGKEIPVALKEQLKIGGKLIMPIGDSSQDLVLLEKEGENKFKEKHYPGFSFVPLITDL